MPLKLAAGGFVEVGKVSFQNAAELFLMGLTLAQGLEQMSQAKLEFTADRIGKHIPRTIEGQVSRSIFSGYENSVDEGAGKGKVNDAERFHFPRRTGWARLARFDHHSSFHRLEKDEVPTAEGELVGVPH
ncbi:hypothetical protein [Haloferula sargassicola]|uniref:Uncharacterized protein n=1 Tax=Haloferula sargassicola TaxID=490096 RepID=A0ABP9UKR3_9BACT